MNKISVRNIYKDYPPKKVLNDISLDFYEGKLHILMGENGAGKTTLASILYGLTSPSSGQIFFNDIPIILNSPHDAISHSISMVQQTPVLAGGLRVWQNIVLGKENYFYAGILQKRKAIKEIQRIQKEWPVSIDNNKFASKLSASERFYVSLMSCYFKKSHFIILDEPTSSLEHSQRNELFKTLKKSALCYGIGYIIITHNIDEAIEYGDTITILKHGSVARQFFSGKKDFTKVNVIKEIFGREEIMPVVKEKVKKIFNHKNVNIKKYGSLDSVENFILKPTLKLRNVYVKSINHTALFNISFKVFPSKITAIIGQRESGLDTLEELFYGLHKISYTGDIFYRGEHIKFNNMRKTRRLKISFVPFDKNYRGSNPNITIKELLTPFDAQQLINLAEVNTTPESPVSSLSGGMLQKLIDIRELSHKSELYILSEPTQGLDFSASEKIVQYIRSIADTGRAVLILSTSVYHLKPYCDYIYYLSGGHIKERQILS